MLGLQTASVAVGWELYERTGSAWSLGLVGVFELLPVLLLMVPSGLASDRFARRNVALVAGVLIAAALFGLALVSRASAPVAATYALLVLLGTGRAFGSPATSAMLPEILSTDHFLRANAGLASMLEISLVAGPALGGWLIALSGSATWAYLAGGFGQLIFLFAMTRLAARQPEKAVLGRGNLFAGLSFIGKNPVFLAAITLDLFAVLFAGAVALLPIFAKDILNVGPVGLGWLRAAPSLGAFLMALALTRLPPWKQPGRVLLWAVTGFAFATLGFGLSKSMALSMCCLFLVGVFDEISVVIRWTLEQVITPNELRGRVSAVHYVFIGFSNELGSFESGVTAALFGPVASVAGGGLAALAIVAWIAWKWPQLARLPPLATLRPEST